MFTLAGYYQNVDTGGALTYINALPDQHLRVEGYNIIVPEALPYLGCIAGGCSSATQVQFEAPSLRRILNPDVYPYSVTTLFNSGSNIMELWENPLVLTPGEPVRIRVSEGASGATDVVGLVWFTDGRVTPVEGEFFTLRCNTSTVTSTFAWANTSLILTQTLPAGRYGVVGMGIYGGNIIAGRLVFVGLPWRPGVTADTSLTIARSRYFRFGNLGIWGEFTHDQPPTIDLLVAASASAIVFLDLVRLE